MTSTPALPLTGVRVLEMAGLGPVPFAAMLLADHGAQVVQLERPGHTTTWTSDPKHRDLVDRRRRRIEIDVKNPVGRDLALALIARSDVLLEGFRPGTMERLGLGPDVALDQNPSLIYGRMTGWGQTGPLAETAGHDIDYLAVTGALAAMGDSDRPPSPPLNLVADYGGGAMFLALGVVTAVLGNRLGNCQGQVVDAAMIDGASLLTTTFHSAIAAGMWSNQRSDNILDGGAPWYATYRCADGKFLALGTLEPKFYTELIKLTGFDNGRPEFGAQAQYSRSLWPVQRVRWGELIASRDRDDWTRLLADSDACTAPVLDFSEAPDHPQLAARGTYVQVGRAGDGGGVEGGDGHRDQRNGRNGDDRGGSIMVPAPAPRFSQTPLPAPTLPTAPGSATDEVLGELGLTAERIAELRLANVIG